MRLCFHYALYRYMFKYRKKEKKIKNNIIDSWNQELKIGRKKKRERSAICVFFFRSEHRFNVRDAIEDENSSLKKIATFIGMHRNRDRRPSFWRARATGSYSRDARLQPEHMEHREDLNSLVKIFTEIENTNSW